MSERITSYSEFWPYYLREHSRTSCRVAHYIGTSAGIVALVLLIATGNWWWLLVGLVSGYGPAWIGHYFFEKNRPATFQYPFWSFYSDFRMYFCFVSGRLGTELSRAGVSAGPTAPAS